MAGFLENELERALGAPTGDAAERREHADRLLKDQADTVYAKLIQALTGLEFDPPVAQRHWREILDHLDSLHQALGRNVGIRVASVDYFVNVHGVPVKPPDADPTLMERLYREAIIDPLTGLPNRRHYCERLNAELHRSMRYGDPFVLALLDLDDFKAINDTRGHTAGDRVLRRVATCIQSGLREADMAARWGGEEFVLLLPSTHKQGGLLVAERIRLRIESELADEGVTVSGGVAACPADGEDAETLFTFADRGLYRAKAEGKNRICALPGERRAYRRLDTRLKVLLRPAPVQGDRIVAQTRNIGAGGIAFEYEEPYVVGFEVIGEIEIEDRHTTFRGQVTRVEALDNGQFEFGVQFTEITPDDRELILSYTGSR